MSSFNTHFIQLDWENIVTESDNDVLIRNPGRKREEKTCPFLDELADDDGCRKLSPFVKQISFKNSQKMESQKT